eukprot:21735_4
MFTRFLSYLCQQFSRQEGGRPPETMESTTNHTVHFRCYPWTKAEIMFGLRLSFLKKNKPSKMMPAFRLEEGLNSRQCHPSS